MTSRNYIESMIQRAAVRELRILLPRPCRVFHVPNGGQRNLIEAKHLKNLGVERGVADICVLLPGRVAWLEVKAPGQKQRPEQKQFEADVTVLGMEYLHIESDLQAIRWAKAKLLEMERDRG